MRAFSPALPPAKRPTSAWTPAALATLRQWLADNYYSSPVGGLQVIESLEPHGTVRAPQPGACALFDGVNDYGYLGVDPIPLMASGAITVWIEPNGGSDLQFLVSCRDPDRIYLGYSASNEIYITLGSTNFTNTGVTETTRTHVAVRWTGGTFWVYRNGVQIHTGAYSGSTGGTSSCIGAYSASGNNASLGYFKGCIHDLRIYNAVKSEAELLAIYNTDFSDPDITGLWAGWYFNDRAGAVARDWSGNGRDLTLSGPITESIFWAEDSAITANPANVLGYTLSGSTIIPRDESDITKDVQGNALGNTGLSPYPVTIDTPCITFSGTDYATVATLALDLANSWTVSFRFNQTTIGITDLFGFGDSFGTGIAFVINGDNKITYVGNGGYGGLVSWGPVIAIETWHTLTATKTGSTVELYLDGVSIGSATATSPTASSDLVLLGSLKYGGSIFTRLGKKLADLRIYPVAKSSAEVLAMFQGYDDRTSLEASWKCQEGPGTASDNRTLYDDSGNGNDLTVVGGTVATQWANLCPGYVRDHAFEYGGRLDALGAFCPLVPGTSLCADGNAPTIAAGNITGNPYSRVDFDPFDAAELGASAVPGEFDSLPCVTGNGTNNYVDMGSALIPATADFEVSCEYYHATGDTNIRSIFDQRSSSSTGVIGVVVNFNGSIAQTNALSATLDNVQFINSSVPLVPGSWNTIRLTRVGNLFTLWLNGVSVGTSTYALTVSVTQSTVLMTYKAGMTIGQYSDGRISEFSITIGGTPKLFPLTDGSGRDIACYEAGVATIISNAIQGTLTNVWSNKTDGQVDHEFPEAVRAIVPRDTKFTNGSTKTITTSEPATGADLTNILGYIG